MKMKTIETEYKKVGSKIKSIMKNPTITQTVYRIVEREMNELQNDVNEKINLIRKTEIKFQTATTETRFSKQEKEILSKTKDEIITMKKKLLSIDYGLYWFKEQLKNKYIKTEITFPNSILAEFLGTPVKDIKDRKLFIKNILGDIK